MFFLIGKWSIDNWFNLYFRYSDVEFLKNLHGPLIIFANNLFASLAHFYFLVFTNNSKWCSNSSGCSSSTCYVPGQHVSVFCTSLMPHISPMRQVLSMILLLQLKNLVFEGIDFTKSSVQGCLTPESQSS